MDDIEYFHNLLPFLLITQASLYEPADSLMPQIIEM